MIASLSNAPARGVDVRPPSRARRHGPRWIALAVLLAAAALPTAADAAKPAATASVIPIHVDSVVVQNGNLVAHVTVGTHTIDVPVSIGATDAGGSCDVLNLMLGPIHLDLLGLQVDTSMICADVTATTGPGQLLGNLVCSVAGLLDQGLSLADVLATLSAQTQADLFSGIAAILNAVLDQATAPAAVAGVSGTSAGSCDILNLSVGPIDLNVLGLGVSVDDCHGGPVTVDVTAEAGSGKLLGNLLCNLSHVLDSNAGANAITRAIDRVARALAALLG
jgi:hypothetical protein